MDPVDLILLGVIGFFVFMVMSNKGTTSTNAVPSSPNSYVFQMAPNLFAMAQQQNPQGLQQLQALCTMSGGVLSADGMSCTIGPSAAAYPALQANWSTPTYQAQLAKAGTVSGNTLTITNVTL